MTTTRISRRLALCTLILLALTASVTGRAAAASTASAAAGPLDGKTFHGETVEVGKKSGDKDTFVFKAGTFRSTACDKYGFGDAAYTATKNADGSVAWSATTTSAKEGKMEWKGTVQGDAVQGTITWTKAGQKTIDYTLKGTAKP